MIGAGVTKQIFYLAAFCALGSFRFSHGAEAVAPGAAGAATNRMPAVIVLGFKGAPSVQKGNRWYPLAKGELIPPGVTIRTGQGDSMDIMLDEPGRIISLASATVAVIDLTRASVNLESGEIVASIRKTTKDNTSVIIRSRFGVSTVRAADFRVMLNPVPSIAVLDGVVEFEVARAQSTAPALQLRGDAHVIAGPEDPIIRMLDAESRGFITGRIDALVSAKGAAAMKFWARPDFGACHTPPLPGYIDPDVHPGRLPGWRGVPEYAHGAFPVFAADGPIYPKGAAGCPVHTHAQRAVEDIKPSAIKAKPKPWEEE